MELAISEAKRAGDRGDYPIGAVITRLVNGREVVIASAGNRVKTSGSSIKHVELEPLKYVSSGYGRYLPDFVLYSTHEPCAMCAGACVWSNAREVVISHQEMHGAGSALSGDHDVQGLNTATSVTATSFVLWVTRVRLCCMAVAASSPSITGSGDFPPRALAAIRPQRSGAP